MPTVSKSNDDDEKLPELDPGLGDRQSQRIMEREERRSGPRKDDLQKPVPGA